MHHPSLPFWSFGLLIASALAQAAPPPAPSPALPQPAAAVSVASPLIPALVPTQPAVAASAAPAFVSAPRRIEPAVEPEAFTFRPERPAWRNEPPPPRANDKAAVMGQTRPWQDGRPPVSCPLTPLDPACR